MLLPYTFLQPGAERSRCQLRTELAPPLSPSVVTGPLVLLAQSTLDQIRSEPDTTVNTTGAGAVQDGPVVESTAVNFGAVPAG